MILKGAKKGFEGVKSFFNDSEFVVRVLLENGEGEEASDEESIEEQIREQIQERLSSIEADEAETASLTENTIATEANTAAQQANTLSEEDSLATQGLSIGADESEIASLTGNTIATNANTTAEQANTLSEEEALAAQWLSISGDEAEVASITANTVATNANTVAEQTNTLAEQDALAAQWLSIGADEAEVASTTAATAATTGATTATVAHTGAVKASTTAILSNVKALGKWIATSPVGVLAAIAAAVGIVVVIYDSLTTSIDEAREALDESSKEYETTTSELESLQKQLESTQDKMKELESGGITLVEEGEYEELKKTNDELERTIGLKEAEQLLNAQDSANDAVELYNKYKIYGTPSEEGVDDVIGSFESGQRYSLDGLSEESINETVAGYEMIQDRIKGIETEMSNYADDPDLYEAAEKNLEYWYSELDTFREYLTTQITDLQNIQASIEAKKEKGMMLSPIDNEALQFSIDGLEITNRLLYGIKEYSALDIEGKRDRVSEELQNRGITSRNAENIVSSLSEEDLELAGQINFDEVDSIESFNEALEELRKESQKKNSPIDVELQLKYDKALEEYEKAVEERKKKFHDSEYVGNVDIHNRPTIITGEDEYATTLTSFQEGWYGDEENGSYRIIHFTPILPNGTVLTEGTLNDYINKLLQSENPLEADKVENGGYGIVYKVDTEVNGQKITDGNLQDAFGIAEAWDIEQHELQDSIYRNEGELKIALANVSKEVANYSKNTIADSVLQISQQLKPQMDELAEAYQNIFTEKGFTLDNVDNDMLEGLRSAFADIEEDLGVDFDTSELNSFFNVLTNGSSTAEQVQQAFNNLATSYLYSTDTLENLNEETASAIEQQLEEMGVTNANAVVTEALAYKKNELAVANLYAAETGEILESATAEEIAEFAAEQAQLGILTQEMAQILMQKIAFNSTTIDSAADIDNLYNLAVAAGASAEMLDMLNMAKSRFTTNSTGDAFVDSRRASKDTFFALKYGNDTQYEPEPVKINFDGNSIKDAEKSGKEAADKYLEAFEKEYELLKNLLDWGLITEKEYLDQLRILYNEYFKDREKYLEEYMKYEQEYLEGIRDLYNDVISYITSLIDDQIDAYGEQKDAAVDALEEQRDAAVEAYEAQKEAIEEQIKAAEKQKEAIQDQIDAKQDEIDAINDAADARKREMDLQKAQYEAERARNQRTKFIYRDGQMVYEADPTAIREADEEVADIEREKQIAAIEEEIKLLEKQQEQIDDYISRLEERQSEIDVLIDSTNDYYDGLIESTEAYWDGLIENLEDYKSRWDELAELEENAKMQTAIEQLGYSTEDILSMSEEAFQRFKGEYLGVLNDIYSGNQQMLTSIGQLANADMFSGVTGYLEQTQAYIDSLNQIDLSSASAALASIDEAFKNTATSAGEAANAIVGTGGSTDSGESSSGSQGQGSTSETSGGSGVSFNQALEQGTESGVENIEQVSNAFAGDDETSVTGSIEQVNEAIGTPSEGGSSGKGSGEGEEGSDSLTGTLEGHVGYAKSEEGIPAETEKFMELKDVLSEIDTLLTNIQTTLESLSSNTYEIKVSGIGGMSIGGYASGTKKLKESEVAWTQEKGKEMIVSPTRNAILTPLEKGDSVINDKLTDNLFKWGSIDPDSLRAKQGYNIELKNIPINIQNNNRNTPPNLSIDNVTFTCTGVTGEQVLRQIEGSFKGLFLNAYQQATTKK